MEVRTIAVVGAGTIGRGLAVDLAMHGYEVILNDLTTEALGQARDAMRSELKSYRILVPEYRELDEEVGVQVSQIRYFASQPWPFPHSLMIAFVCDWQGGEIRPREGEIEDAQWFDVLQLPKLPSRISIARRLIDAVTGEMKARLA